MDPTTADDDYLPTRFIDDPPGIPPQDRPAILAILRDQGPALRAKYAARSLALFGSMARGDNHARSDVDVFVQFDEGQTNFDNFMGLKIDLEERFGRRVDLLTPGSTRDAMRARIEKDFIYAP